MRVTKFWVISFLSTFFTLAKDIGDFSFMWVIRYTNLFAIVPAEKSCLAGNYLLFFGAVSFVFLSGFFFFITALFGSGVDPGKNYIQTNFDEYGFWIENYTQDDLKIGKDVGILLCVVSAALMLQQGNSGNNRHKEAAKAFHAARVEREQRERD